MAGLVLQQEKESHWVRYIKQRIKKNKNMLVFIGGPTGTGKSYTSLRIAEELDPEFDISRCVFSGKELMHLINSGVLKSGNVIVFEEVGVELSHKNWQGVINKMINFLLQTFRHKRFILIMNSPFMDFVDSSCRKLFHAELQTVSIDFKQNTVRLKPQLIQYNSRLQKFYYKYLRVVVPGEGVLPVKAWNVSKPSEALRKEYEKKKLAFTTRLNQEILNELESVGRKKAKPMFTCLNCSYQWRIRGDEKPARCPKCSKRPY